MDSSKSLVSIKTEPITLSQSGEMTLHLTGTIPQDSTFSKFMICVSYASLPNNNTATWAGDGCKGADRDNLFFNSVSNLEEIKLNLRENSLRDIYISVSLATPDPNSIIQNVTLNLDGFGCYTGQFYYYGACRGYSKKNSKKNSKKKFKNDLKKI